MPTYVPLPPSVLFVSPKHLGKTLVQASQSDSLAIISVIALKLYHVFLNQLLLCLRLGLFSFPCIGGAYAS